MHWVQEQDFYENTAIILCGDHPTMDKDFCKNVSEDYQRKTYVSVINAVYDDSSFDPDKYREYDTFDMFPTTLAAMNVTIPGNRLGLGVNLFSDVPTLVEEFGYKTCQLQLTQPSAFMDRNAGFEITEEMLEDTKKDINVWTTSGEDGSTCFNVSGIAKHFIYPTIEGVELELTDKESGKTTTYDCELVITNDTFLSKYYWSKTVDTGDKSPDDYDVNFYITIGDFKHYKLTE